MIHYLRKQSRTLLFLRSTLVGRLTLIGGLALVCGLAAGCGSDNNEALNPGTPGNPSVTGVPLFVSSAGIEAKVETAATPGTRSNTTLGKDATIGLFLRNASGVTSYAEKSNISYTCNGNGWNATTESEILYLTGDKAVVYAYRPWNASAVGLEGKFWLSSHIQEPDEIPLALGRAGVEVNADKKEASFVMQPAYACLTLKITRADTAKDDVTINQIILSDAGGKATIYKSGAIDPLTNATIEGEDRNHPSVEFDTTLPLGKGTTETRHLLMFPGTYAANHGIYSTGLKIGFCITEYQNKVMSATISAITQMERGKQYVVNLTVNGADVVATKVETLDWTAAAVGAPGTPLIPLP